MMPQHRARKTTAPLGPKHLETQSNLDIQGHPLLCYNISVVFVYYIFMENNKMYIVFLLIAR